MGRLGLGGRRVTRRFEAGVQAALVSRNCVLVKDALLDFALVRGGDGRLELGLGHGDISLDEETSRMRRRLPRTRVRLARFTSGF